MTDFKHFMLPTEDEKMRAFLKEPGVVIRSEHVFSLSKPLNSQIYACAYIFYETPHGVTRK